MQAKQVWQTVLAITLRLLVSIPHLTHSEEIIQWNFDQSSDISHTCNIDVGRTQDGYFSGETTWDPQVWLKISNNPIDARKYTWMTVRLYSSEAADLLDIYYQSPDKQGCLGGSFPVAKGWAIYRIDLTKNQWRETEAGDASKQWGGTSKLVQSLRLDPGNQSGRWVALDYVKLHAAHTGLKEGATVEPRGTAQLIRISMPKTIEAGESLPVGAEFEITMPQGLDAATAWTRLTRDKRTLRWIAQKVTTENRHFKLHVEIPISNYWQPGTMRLEFGVYEFDLVPGPVLPQGELQVTSHRITKVHPPQVTLQPVGGDPTIHINGHPIPGYAFLSDVDPNLDYHREIAQHDIHLYSDWFGTSRHSDLGHVAPDCYDYANFDRYFAAVLDIDPEAYFIPHLGVTGPIWWQQQHPEEMCLFENGTQGPTSFASRLWRKEMGEDLRKLIGYLRQTPYADRILGYVFYSGLTCEWQMWGTWQKSRCDYSQPALLAFRAFLKQRYGTDEQLCATWGDPNVTLTTAMLPDSEQRHPKGNRVLRDPDTERSVIDFYEFINKMTADALLHFARIVRETTHSQSLVGTYYAYLTAHGMNQQDSGHLAAKRVFDSPDIDFLISPPNYTHRQPGETSTFMSATDSLRLRGKLWLDESDHRTYLSDSESGYGRASTLEETRGVFWREFSAVLTKRAAVSWYDMGGGWFSDSRILADLGQGQRIMSECLAHRKPFNAEIGVFVDPQSFYWMRSTMANAALVLHQTVTMPQSGAPWDFCLLDDIAEPWLPDYKFYIFLNAFYMDPTRRDAIHAKLKKNSATALFVYAAGYFGPSSHSIEHIQALTGIKVAKDDREGRPQLVLEPTDPLANGIAVGQPVGTLHVPAVTPIFYAEDPDARIVGRMEGSSQAGLVIKKMEGWTSIYSGAMQLPPNLMRNLARSAGVHIWLESNDALYTDGQYVGIHAASEGTKILNLPGTHQISKAITGETVCEKSQTVSIPMALAETVLFRIEPSSVSWARPSRSSRAKGTESCWKSPRSSGACSPP